MPSSSVVKELIHDSIIELNNQFDREKRSIKLDFTNLKCFELKQAKKNGLPKDDYPNLNKMALLSDIKASTFALICKEGGLMVFSTTKEVKNDCCERCSLF